MNETYVFPKTKDYSINIVCENTIKLYSYKVQELKSITEMKKRFPSKDLNDDYIKQLILDIVSIQDIISNQLKFIKSHDYKISELSSLIFLRSMLEFAIAEADMRGGGIFG